MRARSELLDVLARLEVASRPETRKRPAVADEQSLDGASCSSQGPFCGVAHVFCGVVLLLESTFCGRTFCGVVLLLESVGELHSTRRAFWRCWSGYLPGYALALLLLWLDDYRDALVLMAGQCFLWLAAALLAVVWATTWAGKGLAALLVVALVYGLTQVDMFALTSLHLTF